jgi:hypothetical protein
VSTWLTYPVDVRRVYEYHVSMTLITAAELSRLTGATRQATSKWINQNAVLGRIQKITDSKGHTGVDKNDPEIVAYIERAIDRKAGRALADKHDDVVLVKPEPSNPRPEIYDEKEIPDDDGQNSPAFDVRSKIKKRKISFDDEPEEGSRICYDIRKTKAQAEGAELKNKIIRNEYLPRENIKRLFGKIYAIHTSIIRPLDAKIGNRIAAELKITDAEKILRVQELISAETYPALQQIKKLIDDYFDGLPELDDAPLDLTEET